MDGGRRPFRFGVIGEAITSRERLLDTAHRAEALGYSTLLLRDHFVGGIVKSCGLPVLHDHAAAS